MTQSKQTAQAATQPGKATEKEAVKGKLEQSGLTADEVAASLLNAQQTTVPHTPIPTKQR